MNSPTFFADLIFQNLQTVSLPKNSIVAPVPLHYLRLCERGYNQSAHIAKKLSRRLELDYQELLIRTVPSKPQAGLHRKERLANLTDAFKIIKNSNIKNRHIILIDDVITTGATTNECSKILKIAGAKSITIATIAHG